MDILMPQLGETVAEGKITSWSRAVGDKVAPGDILFEIETDKTSMEVPATSAGAIKEILVTAGTVVPVGTVVATIAVDGEAAPAESPRRPAPMAGAPAKSSVPAAAEPVPVVEPVKRTLDPFNAVKTPERNFGPAALPSGVRVTPLARRLAAQAGVNLDEISGSGPHGRIVGDDVRNVAAKPSANAVRPPLSSQASPDTAEQVKRVYADVPFVEVELDGMRRAIAKRLTESKQSVPHFYLTTDVDVEQLIGLRKRLNETAGTKVSINDFIVKAFALALARIPIANSVWAGDRVLRFARVDVGVAVAVEGGIFTPVVRSADTKSLSAIGSEIASLAERARNHKLLPADYQGGATAVSNLGMYGVREFAAIINPPHASILAVGAATRRPVEMPDGSVRFSSQITATLSCDHRVIDGAVGAELMRELKKLLEDPLSVLL